MIDMGFVAGVSLGFASATVYWTWRMTVDRQRRRTTGER